MVPTGWWRKWSECYQWFPGQEFFHLDWLGGHVRGVSNQVWA